MTGAVRAFRVLNGIDKNSLEFINAYNDAVPAAPVKRQTAMLIFCGCL